ncbi:MAG: universal stress protein [Chloroflexi bacterium]|nr:universal stress protein [Chloroflexota bacterium]
MQERILVPLDGSKAGEAALPYIEELVSKLSSEVVKEVTLFQAVSPIIYPIVGEGEYVDVAYTDKEIAQLKRQAMNYLEGAGQGLRRQGLVVETRVSVGSAAEEIIKAADEINADLIAMSTHGRSGLSRWAFGSVTDRVMRGGNVPILVVRATAPAKKV